MVAHFLSARFAIELSRALISHALFASPRKLPTEISLAEE